MIESWSKEMMGGERSSNTPSFHDSKPCVSLTMVTASNDSPLAADLKKIVGLTCGRIFKERVPQRDCVSVTYSRALAAAGS